MIRIYCPYTQICPFYRAWSEKIRDKRVDVIFPIDSKSIGYAFECKPLTELDQTEKNIIKRGSEEGAEIEEMINLIPLPPTLECAHILSLSLLVKIRDNGDKLKNLLTKSKK